MDKYKWLSGCELSIHLFHLHLTSIFSVICVISLQQTRMAFKQMNQSAHAQWQNQWCTGNLLQPYWWAILTGFYGAFFPDSSQCGPVSQVNSWKLLNVIHHSLVPPTASPHSQNKLNRWLTVSCPPWSTCLPLWRIKILDKKEPSLQPQMTTFWKKTKKQNFSVRHTTGPLKKNDDCLSGVFTRVVNIFQHLKNFYPLF